MTIEIRPTEKNTLGSKGIRTWRATIAAKRSAKIDISQATGMEVIGVSLCARGMRIGHSGIPRVIQSCSINSPEILSLSGPVDDRSGRSDVLNRAFERPERVQLFKSSLLHAT